MGTSKIDICNVALNLIGENRIRSFDEDNIRARMCDRLYDSSRNYLMSLFDWPFCRAFKGLQVLDMPEADVPTGYIPYQIPSDCVTAIDVHPKGTNIRWFQSGEILYVACTNAQLYYTVRIENSKKFSEQFTNLISEHLASRLCMPIKKDKTFAKELYGVYNSSLNTAQAIEANIGSEYREADERPEKDSFVNPDGYYDDYDDFGNFRG